MQRLAACLTALFLGACNAPTAETPSAAADSVAPPPLPEGAETVDFDRPEDPAEASSQAEADGIEASTREVKYWGVKDGEPLTIMWEDLMPEGSEEQLMREYEEFYAMLEKRYMANTTTLADADPYGAIAEGSELDFMPQLGTFETVTDLDGEFVRIPGYVVPFDFAANARHREFLFVPYMGACIHTPPPPPNQIIFVRADPAIKVEDIWAPFWVEGTLMTEKTENELGDTAYALSMSQIEPYEMP